MPPSPRTFAPTSASPRAWCACRSASSTSTICSPSCATRSSKTIGLFAILAAILAGLALLAALGLAYMTAMPGSSYAGAPQPLTPVEQALAQRLRSHVEALAETERHVDLERPARYIEAAFAAHGLIPQRHAFESDGRVVSNIEAGTAKRAYVVVGAHYDTVPGSPGANDNASGVAALIEAAGLLGGEGLPLRFVAFANEEMPYFMTPEMGSHAWARRARQRGEEVRAMLSLEMLGYYRDEPGSQTYPPMLGWLYSDRADFVAFVGDLGAAGLVRRAIGAFRRHARFPSQGIAAPRAVPGVMWSDHWAFRRHGFPAIMVTDTAFFRYPHYHLPGDTPDKLDYGRLARVTLGLAGALRELSLSAAASR